MVAFRLEGYRRFGAQSTLDLTPRVVAIVGPNEAGKTSLLDALEKLTDPTVELAFGRAEFTGREVPDDDEPILSALYELDADDRKALDGIHGADEIRLWRRERRASGTAYVDAIPTPRRDQTLRKKVEKDVARLLDKPSRPLRGFLDAPISAVIPPEGDDAVPEPEPTVRERLTETLQDLRAKGDTLGDSTRDRLGLLAQLLDEVPSAAPKYARELAEQCRDLAAEHASEHPSDAALRVLDARSPRVRVLRDDDRQLKTTYPFAEVDVPPAPLANLLFIAELDWGKLKSAAAEHGNPGLRTMLQQANKRLGDLLQASWKQSKVSIELDEQGDALHVYPYDLESEQHSRVEDRSEGFKSFLALFTFTARHAEDRRRLILAIDEAELHLHYDAQADLVDILTKQALVPQIIYTTHSAGCLPEDLGSAIRVVQTVPGDRSAIRNGFWSVRAEEQGGAGFTSLLMAMGAGAVAFTPTRRAVITEGPSDALLLPALFRAAMGWTADHPLGLQVAGGLAWTPPRNLGRLEAEASHVVYLTDSDSQGDKYRADLLAAGVDPQRIFGLRAGNRTGLSIEDFIEKETYLEVVNRLLQKERDYEGPALRPSDIPDHGAAIAAEAWMRAKGIAPISKTAVAEHLLRVCRASLAYIDWDPGDVEPRPLLRDGRRNAVVGLFGKLRGALKIGPETGEVNP